MTYTEEFQLKDQICYLNHAAVSPWPTRTTQAVTRFAEQNLCYGSLHYLEWLKTEASLRQLAANLLHAPSPNDIALMKNTSEALSVVAYGIDWQTGDNVVISNQEFPSNRIVWESLANRGVEVRQADLDQGLSPEQAIIAQIDQRTRLVSLSSVQYASGLRMNLSVIGDYCQQHGVLFCVDAIQSVGAHDIDVIASKIDFLAADAHKWMLGPEGIALFYSSPAARERLALTQYGWHMVEHLGDYQRQDWQPARTARRFECGSPNMLGIHALHASLSLITEIGIDSIERDIQAKTQRLIDGIDAILGSRLISPRARDRRAGIVTFSLHDHNTESLFHWLQQQQVFCALRGGGIRLSPHFYTPDHSIDRALELIRRFTNL